MNIQETLTRLTEIGEEIKAASKRAKQLRIDALAGFLNDLAASGTVSVMTFYGYTPGFNDGEPCEHSSNWLINVKAHAREYMDPAGFLADVTEALVGESFYRMSEEDLEKNRKICADMGHVFDKPSSEIMDAIKNIIAVAEDENMGTDYWVGYILVDGKFVRTEGHYDCGY